MTLRQDWTRFTRLALLAVAIALLGAACFAPERALRQSRLAGRQEPPTPPAATATPSDKWAELLLRVAYPYSTPLPPPMPTALDGTYTKFELKEEPPVHCLRCPDYAPEGGLWKLNLDRGIFRIYHAVTGWRSIGSYTVAGDQVTLANDPVCPTVTGRYTWGLAEGQLIIREIEDECAIRLRAMNLTNLPWLSCRPPNREAAVTDHWPKPPGCE
jgi:hypothetical protein